MLLFEHIGLIPRIHHLVRRNISQSSQDSRYPQLAHAAVRLRHSQFPRLGSVLLMIRPEFQLHRRAPDGPLPAGPIRVESKRRSRFSTAQDFPNHRTCSSTSRFQQAVRRSHGCLRRGDRRGTLPGLSPSIVFQQKIKRCKGAVFKLRSGALCRSPVPPILAVLPSTQRFHSLQRPRRPLVPPLPKETQCSTCEMDRNLTGIYILPTTSPWSRQQSGRCPQPP